MTRHRPKQPNKSLRQVFVYQNGTQEKLSGCHLKDGVSFAEPASVIKAGCDVRARELRITNEDVVDRITRVQKAQDC